MGRNEQLLEAIFGTMKSRQGSDCHVATSPRRDVNTSRCQLENLHLIIFSTNGSEISVSGDVRGTAWNSRADRQRLRGSARDLDRFS